MSRKGRGDKKVLEIARTETFGRGNLGSHCLQLMQLIWVAGFDGSCASFIREKFLAALFSAAHRQRGRVGAAVAAATHRSAMSLPPRDQQHDLAFRRMGLVMCEELTGTATAELLEFFCQLSGDAKLPIRHHTNAGGKCLG